MTDTQAVISVRGLCKRYGSTEAVDGVGFDIERGSIFGLLGTNGAGKTTTFKVMLGLAFAQAGEVRFEGEPLRPEMFEHMAYVPERCVLYDWMTGVEHLEMTKESFARFDSARARALVELFGYDVRKKVKQLSKGQQSALALTLAFSIRPRILVLDEPSSGLDPVHQRHVLDLMIDAAAGGAAILFSSHQIGQVERAADHVAIMHKGKIVLAGDVEALRAGEKVVEATFDDRAPDIAGLDSDPHVRRVMRYGRILRAYIRDGGNGVAKLIGSANPTSLRVLDQNLEDIFLAAVGDETAAALDAAREA
ncbi:MAG TPA: ABC transporter ATP-binding protein [Candidatus Eremiobacteraceae bacterium]|nr:ABC transporter ATP-binding protein [Candidatus Eremiobacteraceae bacterium]